MMKKEMSECWSWRACKMNYYLLGTVIVFVFFGTLSYIVSVLDSKEESTEPSADNSGDLVIAEEFYPGDVSGSLPVSNGFGDPKYCIPCKGPCFLSPPIVDYAPSLLDKESTDEGHDCPLCPGCDKLDQEFDNLIEPAKIYNENKKKPAKKSVKKATKKTKKSKKPSKKK
jgi:hypothetical protein